MQDLNPRRTLRAFTQEGCDLHTQEGCDLHYQCKDGVTVAEDCDSCRHVSGSNLRGAITEDGVHYVALRLSLTKRRPSDQRFSSTYFEFKENGGVWIYILV